MNILQFFNISFNIMVFYFVCVLGSCDYNPRSSIYGDDPNFGSMDLCSYKDEINDDDVLLSADICISMPRNQKFLQLGDTLYTLRKRPLNYLEVLHINGFEINVFQYSPEYTNLKRKRIGIEYFRSNVNSKRDHKQYIDSYTSSITVILTSEYPFEMEGDLEFRHHDNGTLTIFFTDASDENNIDSLKPCDIYKDKCINGLHYSILNKNMSFFTTHNFTLNNQWKSVGKVHYCGNGTCHAEYTMNIEQSTQLEYGNEKSTTRSSTIGNSESFSTSLTVGVSAGFSALGMEFGGSVESSVQFGNEKSFSNTYEDGVTVSYSTSTAHTVGVEEKITCDGEPNEKISIETRTNMTHMTGNDCVYVKYDTRLNQYAYKCNYVDLKMYPVYKEHIVNELQCKHERMKF